MRPRIVLTGWLPGAVLLSRGIVPFAVLLAARRGERSGTDMRRLFLKTATSARLWQRRFQLWWLCNVTRALSRCKTLETRLTA